MNIKKIKHWKNFEEFINVANNNCNWLVLRNFEYLPNDFFKNDKDVDILCENINNFIDVMHLRKRSWGVSSYEAIINDKVVPFDVRFLGDGYYDKLWQYKMLKNKIYTSNNVPRMNNEDYFYSLIYHTKIQKKEVKEIYKKRLYDLAAILKIKNYKIDSILNDKYIAKILNIFMKKNYYIFVNPIDINVPKNNNFFQYLNNSIKKRMMFKTPLRIIISKFFPKIILKLIPSKIKKKIKNGL